MAGPGAATSAPARHQGGGPRGHGARRAGRRPLPGGRGPHPGYFSSRDIRRSASGLPPVWQVAQYWSEESR